VRVPSPPARFLVGMLATFLLSGCQDRDAIRSYTASPPTASSRPKATAESPPLTETKGDYRILGAMVPAQNPDWFFRFSGLSADITEHEAEFDQFLKGVRFPQGTSNPPVMDLPEGWKQQRAGGFRYATVSFSSDGKPFEIAISTAKGGLQGNLQRWWTTLLGNPPREDGDYMPYTTSVDFPGGLRGARVNMAGPKNPSAAMPAMPGMR